MFRINKLSDYGLVLLTHFARMPERPQHSAVELAAEAHLPLPTVGKLLKVLAREGLLASHRGAKGGYSLARRPEQITVAQIIRALEGPIAITECSEHEGSCEYESACPTSVHFKRINQVVLQALDKVTLLELAYPIGVAPTATVETVFPLPEATARQRRSPARMAR
ncbi:MAG: SUF system Fe-S cluster assembly regulator [Cyanobacteria bacterium REEB65]|nr:SUF system Fe-S cluster assembly regulator [Cyanobacteria bacterium REEB65]